MSLSTTGKKAILQDRIKDQLSFYIRRGDSDGISQVANAVDNVIQFGQVIQGSQVPSSADLGSIQPTYTQQVNNLSNTNLRHTYHPFGTNEAINSNFQGGSGFRPLAALQTSSGRSTPANPIIFNSLYNQRRDPGVDNMAIASKMSFEPSPFFKPLQILHPPIMLYPPYGPRLTRSGNFVLPSEVVNAIVSDTLKIYFLSQNYDDSGKPKFIEFPLITEVSLNGRVVAANTRGIKGKSGTTRPVDLTPQLLPDLFSKSRHAIDITVAFPLSNGHVKAEVQKHVWAMGAYLVQPVKLEKLIDELLKRPKISRQQVIEMIREENSDEDLVATSTVKGLKDPVSYKKMDLPIRSVRCDHIDCFDAQSYFMLQMTASTWDCPVCNKKIKFADLAIDEYFTEIIEKTAVNVSEVEVLPDGTWKSIKVEDSDMDDTDDERMGKPVAEAQNHQHEVIILSDSEDEGEPGPVVQAPSVPPITPASTLSNLNASIASGHNILWPNGLPSATGTASNDSSSAASTRSSPASENNGVVDKVAKDHSWLTSLLFGPSENNPPPTSSRSQSSDMLEVDRQIDSIVSLPDSSSAVPSSAFGAGASPPPGPQKGQFTKPPPNVNVRKRIDDYNAAINKGSRSSSSSSSSSHPFFMTNSQKVSLQRAHRSSGSPAMQSFPSISRSSTVDNQPNLFHNGNAKSGPASFLWSDPGPPITASNTRMPQLPPISANIPEQPYRMESNGSLTDSDMNTATNPEPWRPSSSFERLRSPTGPRSMPSMPPSQARTSYVVDLTMSDDE